MAKLSEQEKFWREEGRRLCREGQGPTEEDMEDWLLDGVCEAIDGCLVETDGHCPHGAPSWFLFFGLI